RGDIQEAESYAAASLKDAERLVDFDNDNQEWRIALVNVLLRKTDIAFYRKDLLGARIHAHRANEELQKTPNSARTAAWHRLHALSTLAAGRSGDTAMSAHKIDKTIASLREAANNANADISSQVSLANTLIDHAAMQLHRGEVDAASRALREAIALTGKRTQRSDTTELIAARVLALHLDPASEADEAGMRWLQSIGYRHPNYMRLLALPSTHRTNDPELQHK
ncbi:MAG: hypothetical protein IT473_07955, partial [Lysobacter sp.]|nr:hypothetical protein [Lysobacter sp.]